MIKLSKRLLVIANMIDKGVRTLDIGCDHALLDIYLTIENNNECIVSDINNNALNQAKKNIEKHNIKFDARLGDGLDVINEKDNIDTIIISGLGGISIIKMLNNNKITNINNIVIQSNTDIMLVRKSLNKLGFIIVDEKLVIDSNIIYTVIKFQKGVKKYSFKELFLGPILLQNKTELFSKKVNDDLTKYSKIDKSIPFKYILKRYNTKKIIRILKNL